MACLYYIYAFFVNHSHPLSSVYPTSEPHPATRKISRFGQDLQRKRIDAKLMPWQAVAVKPCNCGLLYAKVETEDGPSKRAPSTATCNNLEPWSLAKRHTTSSVTTQAKCEGVKVSLRQHKGSDMTYLPGCSLRNLPSNIIKSIKHKFEFGNAQLCSMGRVRLANHRNQKT